MSTADRLMEFLQRQYEEASEEDDAAIRDEWTRELQSLMSRFRSWLADAVGAQLLTVTEGEQVQLSEDSLGSYLAPMLTIRGPHSRSIRVVPVARITFGSRGRVDFESGPNRATLIRVGDSWNFVRDDYSGSPLGRLAQPTKREFVELNKQNFRDTVRDLLA